MEAIATWHMVLSKIQWVMGALLSVYGAYYVVYALLSAKKPKPYPAAKPAHRFAVVVAARNEAAVIGHLVDSLKKQDYPADMVDIFVLPNNCTDDTRGVALRAGATVMDCHFAVKGKGDVLRYAVAELSRGPKKYDAMCVFDADNVVDSGFLRGMNNALCAGAQAAQGFRESKNPHDSWISGCYTVYYWMVNLFFNRARTNAGLSAMFNGSGFMVRMDVLEKMGGWNTHTMTEDLEFSAQCALADVPIYWVPEALTYDEQPLTFAQSWKQRRRWTTGTLQCSQMYGGALAKKALKSRDMRSADLAVFFSGVGFQMLAITYMVLSLALTALSMRWGGDALTLAVQVLLEVDKSYFVATLTAAIATFAHGRMHMGLVKGVLGYWIFIGTWFPLTVACIFKKETTWRQIDHTRAVKLEQINTPK